MNNNKIICRNLFYASFFQWRQNPRKMNRHPVYLNLQFYSINRLVTENYSCIWPDTAVLFSYKEEQYLSSLTVIQP